MKTFRFIGFALFAVLMCLSACSSGGDDPIEPTLKPEVTKSEITIDSNIITNGLSFTNEKGEQSISFSTNENWTLSVASTTSGTTWCTASTTSGTKGSVNVKFSVLENTTYNNRSVSVTIKSGTATKTFTISQKGTDALLVTTDKYEVSQEGGTIEIEVKANISYKMEISEKAKDWIKESSSRGLTTYKHKLDIATNGDLEKREGEIYFKSGDKVETVKVYQAGGALILLSQNEYTVSDAGETISVDIKSNIEYDVQMPDVDWITDEASSRGLSSHTLKYVIKANEGYDSRSAEIVFFDKNSDLKDTLIVNQVQKDAIILSNKEYIVNEEGGTIEVKISTNIEFEVVMPNVDWISQTESRALKEHTLYLKIDKNKENKNRQACVILTNQNVQLSDTIIIKQTYIPYLMFVADEKQTLKMSKSVETLEYSVGGGDWKELGTNKVTFGGVNGNLRLRGKNSNGTARSWNDYSKIQFGRSVSVSCNGDIRTLLDYEKYLTVNTINSRFCYLFERCSSLISAPKLPIEVLASECYREMFSGCTNLTEAPELPATTLNRGCYFGMFKDCSSLTEAPELPATNMRSSCYYGMFENCSNLTISPELPAITLASGCYQIMFRDCRNLVQAPELPATTLTDGCYEGMFIRCVNLTEAPELPATILTEKCYSAMFTGCSKLTIAPELPATTLAEECYFMMFQETGLVKAPELPAMNLTYGCYDNMFAASSIKEAPELPATTLAAHCYFGMFGHCTNLIIAPKLPATRLENQCYGKMFNECINLREAPVLPATTLTSGCYYEMFCNCSQLNSITMLATNISASECLKDWVEGVGSTGTFTKAKEMETLPNGYSGIPNGWTVKNYGEEYSVR